MASLLGGGDPDDTEAPYERPRLTPASLHSKADDGVAIPAARPGGDPKAIWDASELMDDFEDVDEDAGEHGLLVPEYEFLYKQAVSTADAFLGMAHNKDPGSRSCEDVVCKVHLPGTRRSAARPRRSNRSTPTPIARLQSQRVPSAPRRRRPGKAEWDQKAESLKITLPIIDEDYFLAARGRDETRRDRTGRSYDVRTIRTVIERGFVVGWIDIHIRIELHMHVHKLVCHIGHGSLYKEKHAPPVHVQMGSAAHSD